MSTSLLTFLTDWLSWAETGAPPNAIFDRAQGLCGNGYIYSVQVYCQLQDRFDREFLDDPEFPFNENIDDYTNELDKTLNLHRLEWVRRTIKELS